MAVPSSGAISLLGIKRELVTSNYASGNIGTPLNISLKECSDGTVATINTDNDASDRPNGSAPHSMAEFYSYNHDEVSVTTTAFNYNSEPAISGVGACSFEEAGDTAYHDGSGTYPAVGDGVYTNSGGTTSLANGVYKIQTSLVAGAAMGVSGGSVTSIGNCK